MVLQLRTLWATVREFDVRELRDALEHPLQLAIVGSGSGERAAIIDLLGGEAGAQLRQFGLHLDPGMQSDLRSADLILFVISASGPTPEERSALDTAVRTGVPTVLLIVGHGIGLAGGPTGIQPGAVAAVLDVDLDEPEAAQRELASTFLQILEARSLALARQLPALREPIVDRLIRDTSLANAEFALLSSLPAWIPLFGGLAGSAADLLVLTKNQVLLVCKLAGVYGRDLDDWRRLLAEIAPVVGGAFVWRTLARTLVGYLPTPVSAVPKTAIAYAGTATVGEIAQRYYRDGVHLDADAIRDLQHRILERLHLPRHSEQPGDSPVPGESPGTRSGSPAGYASQGDSQSTTSPALPDRPVSPAGPEPSA